MHLPDFGHRRCCLSDDLCSVTRTPARVTRSSVSAVDRGQRSRRTVDMLEILPGPGPAPSDASAQTSNETTLFTIISSENPFRNRWYAIAPLNDIPLDRPYGIELFNTPLVVFFDQSKGTFHCILDRCRHRSASLSCGTISKDGNITCLYHGWQYDGDGK